MKIIKRERSALTLYPFHKKALKIMSGYEDMDMNELVELMIEERADKKYEGKFDFITKEVE